ncbi:hypothetical protein HD554DRAFT_2071698 [Boletus coccyginus]|nr:hypothetical protein HD554DRAFT_2071698 [Boletus coccyginus]
MFSFSCLERHIIVHNQTPSHTLRQSTDTLLQLYKKPANCHGIVCDNLHPHNSPTTSRCSLSCPPCDIFSSLFIPPIYLIMPQFKRFLSQLLSLQPKLRQRRVGAPRTNAAVTHRESNSVRKRTRRGSKSRGQKVQPPTDTVPETIEEAIPYDIVPETSIETEVQTVQPSTDTIPENVDEDDDDEHEDYDKKDKDVPEVSPYDLERKTHFEMMVDRLYIAVADNDREIAALRTRDHKKFTHIVRVVFDPARARRQHRAIELVLGGDLLRLETDSDPTGLTALKEKQVLAARNYIADIILSKDEDGDEEKESLAFSFPDECKDPRVLIDVLTVLVCYMAFLARVPADELLLAIKRLPLVHRHWAGAILGRGSVDMASAVAKQKW